MTPNGWVGGLLKGGSRDPKRVGQETPQGWVTRPLRGGSGDTSRVSPVTRGRLVMGSLSAHAWPKYRPETSQPRLGEKPPPGGLPRFFQSSSVTPLRMEEKGDLRSGGFGPEGSAGLPPRTPGARTPGPGVCAPWRQRAAYCWMQVSCGVKERHGHSPGHTGRQALREFHGKSPAHAPCTQVCP